MYTQTELLTVAFCHQRLLAKLVCLAIDHTCSERRIAPQPAHSFHDIHCYTYFFLCKFSKPFFTVQLYTSLPSVLCLTMLLFLLLQYRQVPVDQIIYARIHYAPPVWVLGEAAASNRTSASQAIAVVDCH